MLRFVYDADPSVYSILNDELPQSTMDQLEAGYQDFLRDVITAARQLGHSTESAAQHIGCLTEVRPACQCGWLAPENWRELAEVVSPDTGTKPQDWLRVHLITVVAKSDEHQFEPPIGQLARSVYR